MPMADGRRSTITQAL